MVLDAAEMNLRAGEHLLVRPEQLADEQLEHRVSMHDVPFMETLKLCERFGESPEFVRILVVQPGNIEFGRELSEDVTARFDELLTATVELVEETAREAGLEV